MKLSPTKIKENWNKLITIINDTFSGERKEKLINMYNHFEDRMILAPASGSEHFHNCFPGGYVQHILNIVHFSKQFYQVWKNNGAYVDNFTEEEVVFAAMHHDLGKVGDLENDHYIPNPSDWHRKNQGKIYTPNPELQFMTPPDRGIWILNQFGIKLSINEMLGIKLADGMYDEGNIQYLRTYSEDKKVKINLPFIVHQADMTTSRIEYEQWLHNKDVKSLNNKPAASKKEVEKVNELKNKFDELFAS